jgi:hypothetical protein
MRRIAPALTSLFVVAALALWGAPGALAAPDVSQAAAALRSGDPVYSAPDAENALTGPEVDALANQVLASEVPMFVAVLPAAAAGGGTVDETLTALKDEVGLAGVYAVIVGDQFRAGSTAQSVADLATEAFRAQSDAGAAAVLSEFVALTDQRFSSRPAGDSAGGSSPSGSGSGALVLLLVLVIGGGVVVVVMSRRARKTRELQLTAVRRTVDEDITEYGERLGSFSIADPDFDDATRADMQRALDSYDRAKSSVALMRSPADAVNVTTALEDGRYALACVDARLAGQPLPERRPPCFVDPRHGPSVADVVWAPPGLGERDVPMCAACRTTVETGGQPHSLEVATAGGSRPYYQAGPEYGAYAQGYYSPFAGVMTAVVMGTMLSSMWHVPGVTSAAGLDSAGFGGGDASGFGGFGGGGDFGGGGFGGGDFGGGDF